MKIVYEGLLSLYTFLSAIILPLILIRIFVVVFPILYWESCIVSIILSYIIVVGLFAVFGKTCFLQVVTRATFLGAVFCAGICVSILGGRELAIFGWYVCFLSFFHYSEYLTIAITNPKTLSTDAFMLNHSLAYKTAAAASWIEFFLEYYFYREFKDQVYISLCGLLLCITGEVLRKMAMLTASTNFNHIVQTVKEKDHVLITHGLYGLCRHPSYVGWFFWCIGTQLVLVNPLCTGMYAFASWSFFKKRIIVEEESLINFFGEEYIEYKRKVPSGLPFIRGIPLE